ncbi:MAG: glycosyltransferase family 4 protein [Patescibacteria group bacterium]|nr:glycosyltransferase family 4 protein [Patescibacteria group bacterium]
MKFLSKINLGFFMDLGGSLELWNRIGTLRREVVIYNQLARKFRRIYFFTYGTRQDLNYAEQLAPNIRIVFKPRGIPDLFYEFLMPFLKIGVVRKCDILKTNQNSGALAAVMAKVLSPKARLVIRSGYIGSEFAQVTRFPFLAKIYFYFEQAISYRLCNLALIPTKANHAKLLRKYPFLRGKLKILNNFIDTGLFFKKQAVKKYDIIYVARLDGRQKNHQLLLEAARNEDWKILFIGQGDDRERLSKWAQDNKINLTIIARVLNEKLPDYYNACRLFVSPSLFEGNPKAMLEAMSSELPVIALSVPGIKNIINHGKTGILVENSALDLKKNIQQILRDEETARELGRRARRFVLKKFALDKLFIRERKIYQRLLKGYAKKNN